MDATVSWLMEGDPVIRWQVMRDLLDAPVSEWSGERSKVVSEGWGASFLAAQGPDGKWPEGRWTGTLWTLLVLMDCGMPVACGAVRDAARRELDHHLPPGEALDRKRLVERMDLCHLGFWLRYGSYFLPGDSRLGPLAEIILSLQLADGGWNCRLRNYPQTVHSSFHTTFNVLEGLREACSCGALEPSAFRSAEARALEFMLAHRMFKSDKTGAVVSERFLELTFPSHWHYTVLRGLDYMRLSPEISDSRLSDALEHLAGRRKANGRWVVEKRIPGVTLFEMERLGGDSRWNTLRTLRVLRKA